MGRSPTGQPSNQPSRPALVPFRYQPDVRSPPSRKTGVFFFLYPLDSGTTTATSPSRLRWPPLWLRRPTDHRPHPWMPTGKLSAAIRAQNPNSNRRHIQAIAAGERTNSSSPWAIKTTKYVAAQPWFLLVIPISLYSPLPSPPHRSDLVGAQQNTVDGGHPGDHELVEEERLIEEIVWE
jgi:hypothetical protein